MIYTYVKKQRIKKLIVYIRISNHTQIRITSISSFNKYFELKKLVGCRWGAPNSNYLLVMVSTFVMSFNTDPLNPRMTSGCITQ